MVEVLHVMSEKICVTMLEMYFHLILKIYSFDIHLLKTKPITIGILYRPPNQDNFIDILSKDFSKLQTEANETYILGDLNINLLQNGIYILDKNNNFLDNVISSSIIKKYKEFCCTFGLKQIIQHPTRITCNTSTLLDHILSNSDDKVIQHGIIDVGLSDHQLIYFTRKSDKA